MMVLDRYNLGTAQEADGGSFWAANYRYRTRGVLVDDTLYAFGGKTRGCNVNGVNSNGNEENAWLSLSLDSSSAASVAAGEVMLPIYGDEGWKADEPMIVFEWSLSQATAYAFVFGFAVLSVVLCFCVCNKRAVAGYAPAKIEDSEGDDEDEELI